MKLTQPKVALTMSTMSCRAGAGQAPFLPRHRVILEKSAGGINQSWEFAHSLIAHSLISLKTNEQP